jgi:hypothetical protein
MRAAVVATATWPGGDGIDVRVPGPNTIVQPASERTVDYTVPFGAAGAPFQKGFNLTAANFSAAPQTTVDQLNAAGRPSFSPVRQMNLETFTSGGVSYDIRLAAYDSTNDGAVNYDSLVFFNQAQGIQPGPFPLPSTGPAYIKPSVKNSALFYYEGHANKAGTRYFATNLTPDLSSVRVARTSATFLPRNNSASVPQVLADVDDINNNVGFWQPQPDFRIVERIDATPSTFAAFPDIELEAIYMELVREFVQYQTNVGLRAITRFPNADLVMMYIEQPDGAGHQFLLTDPRQPTDFTNPNTIGKGQDQAKKARYNEYLQAAYVGREQGGPTSHHRRRPGWERAPEQRHLRRLGSRLRSVPHRRHAQRHPQRGGHRHNEPPRHHLRPGGEHLHQPPGPAATERHAADAPAVPRPAGASRERLAQLRGHESELHARSGQRSHLRSSAR